MKSRFGMFCALAIASTAANAIGVNYSTSTAVSFRPCVVGVSGCDSLMPTGTIDYEGDPGGTSASAAGSATGFGSASASSTLSGPSGAFILTGTASSQAGVRVNSNALALESFTYTGSTTTTRTFGATLTYLQSLTGLYPHANGNGVYAAIDVFTLSDPILDVGDDAESNYDAIDGVSGLDGYQDLGFDSFEDNSSAVAGVGTLGVTVDLTPGMTVWVEAFLQTPAVNGSFVDASHTLIAQWSDLTELTPALAAPVPEPATITLTALGLATLAARRRRRAANHSFAT